MMNNATVMFDPAVTSTTTLVDAIRRTGYGAESPALDSSAIADQAENDAKQIGEYKRLRLKAAVSLIAGLFAMVLSMPLTSVNGAGGMERVKDPLMSWMMCTYAQDGRYEFARRARYGSRFSILGSEHDRAAFLYCAWHRSRCLF
jgi:Cu+-exporting ATPase